MYNRGYKPLYGNNVEVTMKQSDVVHTFHNLSNTQAIGKGLVPMLWPGYKFLPATAISFVKTVYKDLTAAKRKAPSVEPAAA